MNTQNGKYSPAFKFKVVLESLRAEGRGVEWSGVEWSGVEAEVARAYGIHPAVGRQVTPHLEEAVLGAGGGGTRKGRLMATVDLESARELGGRASRELAALGSTKNPPRSRHASPVTHHGLFVIERQMRYYNTERRHSGLDYRAPGEYLTEQG